MSKKEFKLGEVLFVGAGPGDPELITLKGLKALQRAEMVVYAGSLVNPVLLDECPGNCEIHDSAPLNLDEVLALMIPAALAATAVWDLAYICSVPSDVKVTRISLV